MRPTQSTTLLRSRDLARASFQAAQPNHHRDAQVRQEARGEDEHEAKQEPNAVQCAHLCQAAVRATASFRQTRRGATEAYPSATVRLLHTYKSTWASTYKTTR